MLEDLEYILNTIGLPISNTNPTLFSLFKHEVARSALGFMFLLQRGYLGGGILELLGNGAVQVVQAFRGQDAQQFFAAWCAVKAEAAAHGHGVFLIAFDMVVRACLGAREEHLILAGSALGHPIHIAVHAGGEDQLDLVAGFESDCSMPLYKIFSDNSANK